MHPDRKFVDEETALPTARVSSESP
jgi:hypothetical protein